MMLKQFVCGLQAELARSISMHYPKSIAQSVSLAQTIELAVKSSKRPMDKNISGGSSRGPTHTNRGQGQWRGNLVVAGDMVVDVWWWEQ